MTRADRVASRAPCELREDRREAPVELRALDPDRLGDLVRRRARQPRGEDRAIGGSQPLASIRRLACLTAWGARRARARSCAPSRSACTRSGHVPERGPRAERAVADHEPGLVQSARLEVAHHAGPRLGALAVAVLDRQELLDAALAHADHDEQAETVILAQAHRDVDAVDEQIRVAVDDERGDAARGPRSRLRSSRSWSAALPGIPILGSEWSHQPIAELSRTTRTPSGARQAARRNQRNRAAREAPPESRYRRVHSWPTPMGRAPGPHTSRALCVRTLPSATVG
jgi:hypothetical protein